MLELLIIALLVATTLASKALNLNANRFLTLLNKNSYDLTLLHSVSIAALLFSVTIILFKLYILLNSNIPEREIWAPGAEINSIQLLRGFLLHHWSTLIYGFNALNQGNLVDVLNHQYGAFFVITHQFLSIVKPSITNLEITATSYLIIASGFFVFYFINRQSRHVALTLLIFLGFAWTTNVGASELSPGFNIFRHFPTIVMIGLLSIPRSKLQTLLILMFLLLGSTTLVIFFLLSFIASHFLLRISGSPASCDKSEIFLTIFSLTKIIGLFYLSPDNQTADSVAWLVGSSLSFETIRNTIYLLLFVSIFSPFLLLNSPTDREYKSLIFSLLSCFYFFSNQWSPGHLSVALLYAATFYSFQQRDLFTLGFISAIKYQILFGIFVLLMIKTIGIHSVGFYFEPRKEPISPQNKLQAGPINIVMHESDIKQITRNLAAIRRLLHEGDLVLLKEKDLFSATVSTTIEPEEFSPYSGMKEYLHANRIRIKPVITYSLAYFDQMLEALESVKHKNRELSTHQELISFARGELVNKYTQSVCESSICRYVPK